MDDDETSVTSKIAITLERNKDCTYKILVEDETAIAIREKEEAYDKLEDAYLNILFERDMKGLSIHYK